MPIQTVEHWEEKARLGEEAAEAMGHAPARVAMLEIAQLYRQLAGPKSIRTEPAPEPQAERMRW